MGRWPPRLSIASAMRAGADRNPKAILVSSRILVLTDSMSALGRLCSRAAWILSRSAVMRRARRTKAGMRQRRAQDGQRASAVFPAWPLAMNT
jgi:hypothetical protein